MLTDFSLQSVDWIEIYFFTKCYNKIFKTYAYAFKYRNVINLIKYKSVSNNNFNIVFNSGCVLRIFKKILQT